MLGKRRSTLLIFDSPTGLLRANWSRRASKVVIKEGEHGPLSLVAEIRMPRREAFHWFTYQKTAHIELTLGGQDKQWTGRLEDVAIIKTGIRITAFGYWRALSDLPDSALWSTTSFKNWKPVLSTQWGAAAKDRYAIDTNNRLFISPQKNQNFSNALTGAIALAGPDRGSHLLVGLEFAYDLTFPGAGWQARALATNDFVSFSVLWSLNSAAGSQTGSSSVLFTGKKYIVFDLFYNNAVAAPSGADNGSAYLKITNLRVMGSTAFPIDGGVVATELLSQIRAVNPDQLSSSTLLIESPIRDITELVYEDATAAEVLTDLAKRGDNQTPPRLWEVGVDVHRRLYFRPRGSAARDFYVLLADLQLEKSLEEQANSAYGVHQDGNNDTVRTAVSTDSLSVAQRGLTRQRPVKARTTSSTEATAQRDAFLQDHKAPRPRARVKIRSLRTERGARVPLSELRAGDRLTIQDLPPSMSDAIDRIRTFYVKERTYRLDDDDLEIIPEEPIPQLEYLLATR